MSESMAFIGGVAVAGLAALLLLKGTNTPIQPNFAVPAQMPNIMQPQPVQQPPYANLGQSATPNQPQPGLSAEQRIENEKLKMQLEQFKTSNEQLRLQNQQLQNQVQTLTQQQWAWAQQAQIQQNRIATTTPAAFQAAQNPWWSSPIVWAVGGMSLTIGGGIVVAGVLSLFSPKQRHTRTVQVIPYGGTTPSLAPAHTPVRRAEFLPPRVETRRMEAPEYDEI